MNVTKISDDYDNLTPTNCSDNEHNIDIVLPTLLFTIPCGVSFLCLMSLMVHTLITPLFR